MITVVLQGSVLGPLVVNIFINDLFYFFNDTDVCNYADDTNLHACDENLESRRTRLECAANKALVWFEHNHIKLNPDKCHFPVCGHKHECIITNIGGTIYIDRELTFENQIYGLCKIVGRKLNALSRLCKILPFYKRKPLLNAFFGSLYAYCPLVWVCHSRQINTKINNLHYRALRIIYRHETSTFDELLQKDGSVTIHHRNIHALAIEMYKIHNELATDFMREIFPQRKLINIECVARNMRTQQNIV